MPPQYSAYLHSPHARVQCSECHIGRDVLTTQFTRKAGDLRHVVATLTRDYEFPIFAHEMRPARETCERCHFPEKFSEDSLHEARHFTDDEANTLEVIYLIMKTGGGSKREGLGRGIHWHIENEVFFLSTDPLQQSIPYVRVVDEDGKVTEYYDVASGFTPNDIAGTFLERMDCITCHNRITHSIPAPEEAVDQALSRQMLPRELPAIRQQAVALLSEAYPDQQAAFDAFATLDVFYAENYPRVSTERTDEIRQAIATLDDIYTQIVFHEQELDWETHPDNLGHKDSPGCFRCHDGKHLTPTGEAIRLECNVCHSVPIALDTEALVTTIELVRGPEPVSHTHTSWITLHGRAIDTSCAACHPPQDPEVDYTKLEGVPPADGSFCSNEACHVSEWTYTGFAAPALEPILDRQLFILLNTSPYLLEGVPRTYEDIFKAMFDGRCVFCHTGREAKADLDLSTYESLLQGGKNGPGVVPGNPAASLVIQRQSTRRAHFGQMLDDELEALRDWILAGAPEK